MKTVLYVLLGLIGVSLIFKSSASSGNSSAWSLFGNGQLPIPGSATLFRPIVFSESTGVNSHPNDPFSGPGGYTDPAVVASGNTIDSRFNPAAAADQFSPLYGG